MAKRIATPPIAFMAAANVPAQRPATGNWMLALYPFPVRCSRWLDGMMPLQSIRQNRRAEQKMQYAPRHIRQRLRGSVQKQRAHEQRRATACDARHFAIGAAM